MNKPSKIISKNSLRMVKYQLTDTYSSWRNKINSIRSKGDDDFKQEISASSMEENKRLYQKLISISAESSHMSFTADSPMVSLIVDLNGEEPEPLFNDLIDNLTYPNLEILVIGTFTPFLTDFTLEFGADFPIHVLKDLDSLPYSKRLNRAADSANGEYLVFIDGKIRTSQGWLNNLMDVALKTPNIGCVGGKIVYSELGGSFEKSKLYKIMSIGTEFIQTSDGNFEEVPMGNGLDLSSPICLKSNTRASISNGVILVPKNRFLDVKGFDEEYLEHFQVSDLCLKLTKKGYKNSYHPNSLLFIAIQNEQDFNKKIYSDDSKLFNKNWSEFLAKNVLLDKIEGQNIYSIEKFKLGFAVSEIGEDASAGDYFTAKEFGESLKSMGWEVKFLAREGSDYWYDASHLDVVVSLLYTFDPRRIQSSTASPIKVAWPRNWFDRWVFFPWFSSYDLVFTPSKKSQEYVRLNSTQDPFLLPLATNPSRFNMNVTKSDKYVSDYCFTGSYWNDPREIINILDPSELPYRFRLFGKNWDEIAKFKPYFGGFVNYSEIPHVYASTKIVVDDANRATKVYGSVNSRVYDALSSGALVLTNGRQGAEEIFMGMLPVYESKADLNSLLERFLEKDDEREELIEKLQKFVLKNHTYLNRAEELKDKLIEYIKE